MCVLRNMFLDGLLSRNARTFIVLSGMVLLLQRLCERFELPPWCGWVASVVFGGLYHTYVTDVATRSSIAADFTTAGQSLKVRGTGE